MPTGAVPSAIGQGVGQDDKTKGEIQRWVRPSYEIASLLSPKFSHYPRQGLLGPWAAHMGVETLQYRAPVPPPQPPQNVQGTNPQGKTEA